MNKSFCDHTVSFPRVGSSIRTCVVGVQGSRKNVEAKGREIQRGRKDIERRAKCKI